MNSTFDLFALALFVATAGVFAIRYAHEEPPSIPYALVLVASAVGNWLGERGGGPWAVGLFVASSFLLLHLASLPYPEDSEDL